MEKLSSEQINEIAENIDMGMLCFYHVPSGEIVSIPVSITEVNSDYSALYSEEELAIRKQLDEIEDHLEEYISFEQMSSRNAFDVMRSYALSIDHETIKENLLGSLEKQHPFQSFKRALHALPQEIAERFYTFKSKKVKKWVEEQLTFYEF